MKLEIIITLNEEQLAYVEKCLDKSIEKYVRKYGIMVKDLKKK